MPGSVPVETVDDVLTITWNDPDRLSGLTGEMITIASDAVENAPATTRVIVASPVPVVAAVNGPAAGFGTCAQAVIAQTTPAVRDFLNLPDGRQVVCGIAFGHPDPEHPPAQFMSRRAPISDAVTFVD